jgi:hypothetical protein
MAVVLPEYADDDKIREDIAEVGNTDPESIVNQKVRRANQDASSEMEALFLNNFDPDDLPAWFVQITTEYATALFWVKSNGTQQSIDQAKGVYLKAQRILEQRFFPVESRC